MPSITVSAALFGALVLLFYRLIYLPFLSTPLNRIPRPKLYAISQWRLAYEDYKGTRTRTINKLHTKYGTAVRIGPNEVAFNSLSALRTIYGAGSGFERTSFYDMFDAYGKKNLFTFYSAKEHGDRKKLVAHAYSKGVILRGSVATMIEEKVEKFIKLIERDPKCASEIFSSLHYFSLDAITEFLYGGFGRTNCLEGDETDRALLGDIIDVARRKLSWFAVHFPGFTKWLYTRTNTVERIVRPFYPMKKPTTYTGIRAHALRAWQDFYAAPEEVKGESSVQTSIIGRLWKYHYSQKKDGGLGDLDIASECADHLLAGIDTTSDSLMFLIWALSRSENRIYQDKLREEVQAIPDSSLNDEGIPTVEACDKLPYLDAIIKETLRLYAPLPASEPRSLPTVSNIDGYTIPPKTVVGMSPFSLHRNGAVFEDPLKFNPERWFGNEDELTEMKKWFWAFSSGGRMCIGLHLAMAEMTTLVAAIYRKYSTTVKAGYEDSAPGVTSRFEVFHDDTFAQVSEHECWIDFQAR
ncbi:putative P450 monooxygenase [Tothia fuscella]|uniref:P450 monooxygenase n=1 Tax=Tothia fuscella TaxID=1048955 RepID=A0A9P4TWJ1_9PEZI|nr:putative P450 monooxygenase [Tothia fuscella]